MSSITETGARLMVQFLCRSFVANTPYPEEDGDYVTRALVLQRTLGGLLGVMPAADDIKELITSFENLESIEAGTYPGVEYNQALTVDNRPDLEDMVLRRIYNETNTLLTNIGFMRAAA